MTEDAEDFTLNVVAHRMGRVASGVDNALIESFWSTMQRELLDRTTWDTRAQLAPAMFE